VNLKNAKKATQEAAQPQVAPPPGLPRTAFCRTKRRFGHEDPARADEAFSVRGSAFSAAQTRKKRVAHAPKLPTLGQIEEHLFLCIFYYIGLRT